MSLTLTILDIPTRIYHGKFMKIIVLLSIAFLLMSCERDEYAARSVQRSTNLHTADDTSIPESVHTIVKYKKRVKIEG
ncbi:MAG: hypothetical protein LBD17_04745 [Endomicrobium sp.]|jgi:hypothetical protein|nr:hypothetical protein [Endomicrobium sp.]